jgi:hypothetical protein
MTEATRHGGYSPAGPGTPFPPAPEHPAGDWDGDHAGEPVHPGDPGDTEPGNGGATASQVGIDPADLADDDLVRELASLHRTRLDTLRHGPDAALDTHLRRTAELETEYLARHPGREVNPSRLTQDD